MPRARLGRLAWSLCLAAMAAGGARSAPLTIVVNMGRHPTAEAAGHGEANVHWLDADPSDDTVCTECFAAVELQRCLRTMTGRGADFAIVDDDKLPAGDLLLVGGPASKPVADALGTTAAQLAKLGPEGYRIKAARVGGRQVIVVAGGGRVGTLYGAYDLLHRLGCRWFAPGDVHEELPRIDAIPDLDVAEQPDFATRGFFAWENRGDPDFLLWMARNRMNEWCVEQKNHPLMRKLGIRMACAQHTALPFFLRPASPYPYDHPTFKGDEKKSKDPYPLSGEYQGDANNDGTLSYFEAHPEWYAFVKGKRVPGFSGPGGTNYCTSNPHATTEFMKNYLHALTDGIYKGADCVRFWLLDGARWCQCPQCKALGIPTDRNLLLVHRLDQEIKKAQAAGRIRHRITVRFLAYADVLRPPTRPLPKGFDYGTCSATFFPIGRSYVHNIDDPTCARNAAYCRQLHGWTTDPKRHYRGELCIGEYYNVSGFKSLPICFMHTMANDIPTYHKVGARHFHYMHCTTGNWGNKALTNYQMARQLWDVKTDCGALWTDYFARRYGPAAATMRQFYESLEKMLCNVRELKYGLARRLNAGAKTLFPTPQLRYRREPGLACGGPTLVEIVAHSKRCRELIAQAHAAELPARIKARIAEDERGFTYGERTVAYFHECVQAFGLGRSGQRDEARRHFAEARRIADLLRKDTESTRWASSHANAANAFAATYATGALVHLTELLGPVAAGPLPRLDPASQPLVILGRDLAGGGGPRYGQRQGGYELYVVPGRRKVSDHGNHLYAKPTGIYSRLLGWFRLDELPGGPLRLTLVGLSRPVKDTDEIPMEVLVNDKPVYRGAVPFSVKGLSSHMLGVPVASLRKGENKLTIQNAAPKGPIGNRPWFGIDRIELRVAKGEQNMEQAVWAINNVERIGGHKTTVLGDPKVIEVDGGKAVEFDGKDDALLVPVHPLQGATAFTLELLFRPDPGGPKEQRFFHLQEDGSEDRILVETRLTEDGNWYLDTFILSGKTNQTLADPANTHPLGQWHHVALVFDGQEMRHYVDGKQELSARLASFTPPRAGKTSIGVRINRVHWYKGAIRLARFTRRPLKPDEFARR